MPTKSIPAGTVFTRLTVRTVGKPHKRKSGDNSSTSVCDCVCGKQITVLNNSLLRGLTTSCGCYNRERLLLANVSHGHSVGYRTRTYSCWASMIQRCYNPNNTGFHNYGGRGIVVCDRWKNSFDAFLSDMGTCPAGFSIDRWPDKNGNYEPANCRWATRKQQSRNTRYNRFFTVGGITGCLAELCDRYGVDKGTVSARLRRGWPIEKAFSAIPH